MGTRAGTHSVNIRRPGGREDRALQEALPVVEFYTMETLFSEVRLRETRW